MIALASAKNLVYNTEFIAHLTKNLAIYGAVNRGSALFFPPSYPDVVPWLGFQGLLFVLCVSGQMLVKYIALFLKLD